MLQIEDLLQSNNSLGCSSVMPYLTISRLFVEIWTVCSPKEAQGNEKALLNVPYNSAGYLDPEISRCNVVLEKIKLDCMHSRRSAGK